MKKEYINKRKIHPNNLCPGGLLIYYYERTVRSVANLTRQDARELLNLAAEIPYWQLLKIEGPEYKA